MARKEHNKKSIEEILVRKAAELSSKALHQLDVYQKHNKLEWCASNARYLSFADHFIKEAYVCLSKIQSDYPSIGAVKQEIRFLEDELRIFYKQHQGALSIRYGRAEKKKEFSNWKARYLDEKGNFKRSSAIAPKEKLKLQEHIGAKNDRRTSYKPNPYSSDALLL